MSAMESTNPFINRVKTWSLMAVLVAMFVAIGGLLGGQTGMLIALVFALGLNFAAFWFSDTLALKANGARPVEPEDLPEVREMVGRLAARAGIPGPRLYLIDRPEPNAFATGRSPSHSAIAVTSGIVEMLDRRQLEAVLAHELMHVKNRDTLVGTVAAAFGGAISWLAQMAMFSMWFGGDEEGNGNPLALIGAIVLAPIAAMIVQLAVSRGREYMADSTGAALTGDPDGLAQALEKLDAYAQEHSMTARLRGRGRRDQTDTGANPAFNHLYITNHLSGERAGSLFSTHPPIAKRIARLRSMRPSQSSALGRLDTLGR